MQNENLKTEDKKAEENLAYAHAKVKYIKQRIRSDKGNKINIIKEIMCKQGFDRYDELIKDCFKLNKTNPYKDVVDFFARCFQIDYNQMFKIIELLEPNKDDELKCLRVPLKFSLLPYKY